MTDTGYTPTKAEVREIWAGVMAEEGVSHGVVWEEAYEVSLGAFDRWLTAHEDRIIEEQKWRSRRNGW